MMNELLPDLALALVCNACNEPMILVVTVGETIVPECPKCDSHTFTVNSFSKQEH